MSKINLNNYEAFWLDYLEGNLSVDDQADFVLFASQHPELEIDLDESLITLIDTSKQGLSNTEKDDLKELAELEELVILDLDNELDDRSRLDELSENHPLLYQQLKGDYVKIKLSAASVLYDEKSALKQALIIPAYVKWAAAAAVIGIIAVFSPWNSSIDNIGVAETTTPENSTSKGIAAFNITTSTVEKVFGYEPETIQNLSEMGSSLDLAKDELTIPADSSKHSNSDPLNESFDIAQDTASTEFNIDNEVVIDVDTLETPVTPAITPDDQDYTSVNPKNITVPEFLAEKVLKVEKKEEEPLIASILDQKTNWDVDYESSESEDKKVTQFKLGKFEFYKSTKK